jgi:biofilm PGA synthesis N-glycosyltransferase PgaC
MQQSLPMLALTLLLVGFVGAGMTLAFHPLWVSLALLIRGERPLRRDGRMPRVSIIVVFNGGGERLTGKLKNLLALDYPDQRLEVLLAADGQAPAAVDLPAEFQSRGWTVLATGVREGKNPALNLAVSKAQGEILLFTDLDTRTQPQALKTLMACFADPDVGGVCAEPRLIAQQDGWASAQADYFSWDTWIKSLESRLGFLTSNLGFLYAMRRELFRPVPATVTDDLYNALSVAWGGKRMVFEHRAKSYFPERSKDPRHELIRRRRIVTRSLHGLWLNRGLLNPLRFGAFAVALWLNKVFRRLLPFCLLLIMAGSLAGVGQHPLFDMLLAAQAAFYGVALLYPLLSRWRLPRPLQRVLALPFYFSVGNLGMLLGVLDFLRGRRVSTWVPAKEKR